MSLLSTWSCRIWALCDSINSLHVLISFKRLELWNVCVVSLGREGFCTLFTAWLLTSLSFSTSVLKKSTKSSRESFLSISSKMASKWSVFLFKSSTKLSRSFLLSVSANSNLLWMSSFSRWICSISSRLESKASVIWFLNLSMLSSSTLFSSVNLALSSSRDLFSSSSSSTSACSSVTRFVSSSSSFDSETPWFATWPKMFILHCTAASQVSTS